ncbi:hypothetical protein D3C81_1839170 [compost metagenome]
MALLECLLEVAQLRLLGHQLLPGCLEIRHDMLERQLEICSLGLQRLLNRLTGCLERACHHLTSVQYRQHALLGRCHDSTLNAFDLQREALLHLVDGLLLSIHAQI